MGFAIIKFIVFCVNLDPIQMKLTAMTELYYIHYQVLFEVNPSSDVRDMFLKNTAQC